MVMGGGPNDSDLDTTVKSFGSFGTLRPHSHYQHNQQQQQQQQQNFNNIYDHMTPEQINEEFEKSLLVILHFDLIFFKRCFKLRSRFV
jgi:hypothetical protein